MSTPRVAIVIPTYNEKNNLDGLVKAVFGLKLENLSIIIVDDHSPDGTGNIADELAKTYPIRVIHREEKKGLGTAYMEAFKEILSFESESKPDYIFEMDADFSHDPAEIPNFIKKMDECDMVLGSRYVKGGGIENWDVLRKLVSRFGNIYSRTVLWLPYRDLTGGFKCYKRKVLESIDLDTFSSVGYNFQIETTYKAHKNGFHICEIPITFRERKSGQSKFNLAIILESFVKVLFLRFRG
ncbi:MAG: hypothetical protein A3C80_00320 [Candidatus Ryanbacteria bacterium RIFCSPHIGHO2_02_FULL_45_43]|uniref:Glycosyltransferase 2-like domain-containing protein n=1 Tax=Candidatus Ryanbacteria bacterium RIFCSPHIGHO2_01_45_13 TaxID=1802112 RepID=A0A1G2FYR3_9BACT|nr:MAG: hypothetical protein A2718_01710 [Candidatus Ryanbacteria bacterium RIFCSPHIGHO2_01_FULL_44_130]OGZ42750.1 MAG: hypothetical protein A2W41_03355 [Candidatus Ryanbacteria bacterium RIFCSPHIGHO2_01_45_13]OGZ48762.1 MAG: hypothetical protein A3C80_00320 [Candidatus Ryanbacteria bacterium RIFCSPHIGHO2_02_FULL_45_43]OGZ50794.1 MAG: hypothetical protein A3E55_02340 [Candidatus Ryanbacteria bacterium RIFCSPHIGHO2_12_FULL_44_20]OGZ52005.1 MAG: hypothetical protein A3A17_00925 [Candidatus Ryanba